MLKAKMFLVPVFLLGFLFTSVAWSEANPEIAKLVKDLDSTDITVRSSAEQKIRSTATKADLGYLSGAKVSNESGFVALRNAVVSLWIQHAGITNADATSLMQVAREEALAKRYNNAHRCYKRAEQLYDKLEDSAKEAKNTALKEEYKLKKKTADRRKDKAENLSKGGERSPFTLGIVKHKEADDGDW